jgi:arylsulfatase A-like enzyme
MPTRPNILLVVLDSLRRDHLPLYGYPRATTPHLERLASRLAVYEQAVADGAWTPPSVASLFTGLCGPEHEAEASCTLPPGPPTLAEGLARAGYHAAGFTTNPVTCAAAGFARGFSHYASFRWGGGRGRALRGISKPLNLVDKGGATATTALLDHLRACPRPFFGFLHLNETHSPYGAVHPYTRRFLSPGTSLPRALLTAQRAHRAYRFATRAREADYAVLRDLYDGQIAYVDALVQRLWEGLEAAGELGRTVVAVTSDHGELFGEHGLLGHTFGVQEGLVRIPLLLHAPGVLKPGQRMRGQVQLRDLGASLAALGGAGGLAESAAGRVDVFAAAGEGDGHAATFSERLKVREDWMARKRRAQPGFDFGRHDVEVHAVREGVLKLTRNARGETALYDTAADPAEQRDLRAVRPEEAARLEGRLDEWLERVRHGGRGGAAAGEVSAEVLEQMRDLGYVG